MSWIIRRMTGNDIDSVLALEQIIPEAPHWKRTDYESSTKLDENETPLRAGFVAQEQYRLLGFSIGKLIAGVCELESVAVDKEAREQGVGRALLGALTGWAHSHGANRIELEVRASNNRAIKLYERAGIRHAGRRTGYYQSPEEDAVLMGAAILPSGKLM